MLQASWSLGRLFTVVSNQTRFASDIIVFGDTKPARRATYEGGVGLCILLFSAAIAGAQAPARELGKASGDNKYVGSLVCKDCHSEITDTFYKNPQQEHRLAEGAAGTHRL
jgi:hypothetical protein